MQLPQGVIHWCHEQGRELPQRVESLSGGCIAESRSLGWDDGLSVVLKGDPQAPADQFAAEAAGLQELAAAKALRVPRVLAYAADFLLMEDLPPAPRCADYWPQFGRLLARQHGNRQEHFGFPVDTYCGSTRQDNAPQADGHQFFATARLLPLGRTCVDAGLLGRPQGKQLEHLAQRLPQLIPAQPASLLHGDLWSGNAHVGPQGEPAVIDPACYYGWAEADLAMTQLFGGFPPAFYAAYGEASELAPDWQQRAELYNLYHLLNHLYIFGGSYAAAVAATLQRYAGDA